MGRVSLFSERPVLSEALDFADLERFLKLKRFQGLINFNGNRFLRLLSVERAK